MSERPVLACRKVSKSYPSGEGTIRVLDQLDLEVGPGEMLAVVGPSGVGKSTLLHLLGGLDRPDSGTIELDGVDLASLGRDERARLRGQGIGFVFQFHHLLREFTAEENVMMPFLIARRGRAEARRHARRVLAELGLEARAHHYPSELSGGERQRVALARAIAPEPRVVLADEPTGDLDPHTAEAVFLLLCEVQRRRGLCVILVTHDPGISSRCDRIAALSATGSFAPADMALQGLGGVAGADDRARRPTD